MDSGSLHFTPTPRKGRRVPINLQSKVSTKIHKIITNGHIEKLYTFSDQNLFSPIVTTVKHDQSTKLVFDSKVLNKSFSQKQISNAEY